jgi:hypothetical protein
VNDVAPVPTRTRILRWCRRLAVAVTAFVGLVAVFFVYDNWRQQRAWQEACAEADQLDPGWRWSELTAGPGLPDEQNGMVHARAATELLPIGVWNERKLNRPWYPKSQQRTSPELLADLRAFLNAAGPALAEAQRIADCPEGRVALPPSPTLLATPDRTPMNSLGVLQKLLFPCFIVQVEEGDLDGAFHSLQAMVHLSRALAESPALMNTLVAVACRVYITMAVERLLAQGEPPNALLDATRRLLEPEIGRPLLLAAFRGERAFVEDTLHALDDGRLTWADVDKVMPPTSWPGADWDQIGLWLDRVGGAEFRRGNAAARVRHYTWMVERLKESPDGLLEHAEEWIALRGQLPRMAKERMEFMVRYATELGRDEAKFRCAVAAVAAEQFRRAKGRWPATPGELVPQYLTAVPRDPFDRQPLKLARWSDGIVIYSVGEDGKDNGGDVWGGPGRGTDIGVRLWDVRLRRQPAPPKAAAGKKP